MKRTGRTIFFDVFTKKHTQVAVHLSGDNHWSYQVYKQGIKQTKMQRAKFNEILEVIGSDKQDAEYIKGLFFFD